MGHKGCSCANGICFCSPGVAFINSVMGFQIPSNQCILGYTADLCDSCINGYVSINSQCFKGCLECNGLCYFTP